MGVQPSVGEPSSESSGEYVTRERPTCALTTTGAGDGRMHRVPSLHHHTVTGSGLWGFSSVGMFQFSATL